MRPAGPELAFFAARVVLHRILALKELSLSWSGCWCLIRVGLLVGQNVTSGKMWSALGSQLVFYRLPEKVVHGRRVWRKDLDRRRSVIGQQFLHLGGTKAAVVGVPCLV